MIIEASDGYIFLALHRSLIKLQSWNLVFVEVRKSCRLVSVSDVLLDEFVHFTHTYIFLLILFVDRKFLVFNSPLKHQIICMRFCPKIL